MTSNLLVQLDARPRMEKIDFRGMTVNGRLFLSGLMDNFDLAKERHDKNGLVEILRQLEVDEQSIKKILEDSGVA